MKVLITGGTGFCGSHLAEYFRERFSNDPVDLRVVGIAGPTIMDRVLMGNIVKGADYVFHMAAKMGDDCARFNTESALTALRASLKAQIKKFVFSSTSSVYGISPKIPAVEEDMERARGPYALSKCTIEWYMSDFSIPWVSLRYFNVYGPGQKHGVVPKFIRAALANEPLVIQGHGNQTRDFVHVKDVVRANVYFGLESDATGIFNIASGRSVTINVLAEKIIKLCNSKSEIRYEGESSGPMYSVASISKAGAAGFEPTVSLEDGLRETVEAMRKEL